MRCHSFLALHVLCNSSILILSWRSTKTRLQIHKTNSQLHQSCNNSSQVSPFLETSFVLEEILSLDNIQMNATEQRRCVKGFRCELFLQLWVFGFVSRFFGFQFSLFVLFEGICAEAPPLIGLSPEQMWVMCAWWAGCIQQGENDGK